MTIAASGLYKPSLNQGIQWRPYRLGMWIADYLSNRCYLCRCYATNSQQAFQKRLRSTSLSSSIPAATSISPSPHHSLLCQACQQGINWLPASFTIDLSANYINALEIQAATYYDYPIRQAITAFKHAEDMSKLPLLVHVIRQLPIPEGCHAGNSIILPMPTTQKRLQQRGFDPVTIIAYYLSRHWHIPIWTGVSRIDQASTQQGLTRAERLTNIKGAFRVNKVPPVKKILLIDDV
ncbi:MAG: ComF family protein, partial [Psychrobacter sp.]|nr:ComF family protein [Psychrobacter sp.]